jgi:hypothetical protein
MASDERSALSREARLMIGISLLLVPTIVYGGVTVLGIVTGGSLGAPGPRDLSPTQLALYRAGHAHAGVLLILSLVVQFALDHARLAARVLWSVRLAALAASLLVSGGFFAVAHATAAAPVLYLGAVCLVYATVLTGIGLLRRAPPGAPATAGQLSRST